MGTQNGYGIKIFPNKEIVVNGLLKKGPIRDEEKKISPKSPWNWTITKKRKHKVRAPRNSANQAPGKLSHPKNWTNQSSWNFGRKA